jgi:hypothetical protein
MLTASLTEKNYTIMRKGKLEMYAAARNLLDAYRKRHETNFLPQHGPSTRHKKHRPAIDRDYIMYIFSCILSARRASI